MEPWFEEKGVELRSDNALAAGEWRERQPAQNPHFQQLDIRMRKTALSSGTLMGCENTRGRKKWQEWWYGAWKSPSSP